MACPGKWNQKLWSPAGFILTHTHLDLGQSWGPLGRHKALLGPLLRIPIVTHTHHFVGTIKLAVAQWGMRALVVSSGTKAQVIPFPEHQQDSTGCGSKIGHPQNGLAW